LIKRKNAKKLFKFIKLLNY